MISNSESIQVLKDKFNEIKRNINMIEQKQSDFFNNSRRIQPEYLKDCTVRPSSVGRSSAQPFRFENPEDVRKENERLKIENEDLKRKNAELIRENEELKRKTEPVSCIKRDGSVPKKHRVAFSKDLVQVMHEQGNQSFSSTHNNEQLRLSRSIVNDSPVYRKRDENFLNRDGHLIGTRNDDLSLSRKIDDSFLPFRRDPNEPIRASSPFQFRPLKEIDNATNSMYRQRDEVLRNSDSYHARYMHRKALNSTSPIPAYRSEARRSYQYEQAFQRPYRY